MLVYGAKFYISMMAGVLIFRADLLFVNHFRGAVRPASTRSHHRSQFLLMMLPGVIAMLLFPRVAPIRIRGANSRSRLRGTLRL